MSPERVALREAVDRAVRARVERENESLKLCSGCRMPMSDWTPGCHQCWNRHRNYETGRTRCPYPIDPSFWARMRAVVGAVGDGGSTRERSQDRAGAAHVQGGGVTNWRGPKRVPPLRACVDCGDSCRGWSENTRCARCVRGQRALGPTDLAPGGIAEEVRRRRLERQANS